MRVVDLGHTYELNELDSSMPPARKPLLVFVKREGPKFPRNVGHYPGTTTQEVLRACISRAGYVNGQEWSWQTKLGMLLMGITVWLLEHRAAKRHKRKPPGLYEAIYGHLCDHCGHVGCWGHCVIDKIVENLHAEAAESDVPIQPVAKYAPIDGPHKHEAGKYCVGCADVMGLNTPEYRAKFERKKN